MNYIPFGMSKREEYYKLIDPFCMFYLRFVKNADVMNASFWLEHVDAPTVASWRGMPLEMCAFTISGR